MFSLLFDFWVWFLGVLWDECLRIVVYYVDRIFGIKAGVIESNNYRYFLNLAFFIKAWL